MEGAGGGMLRNSKEAGKPRSRFPVRWVMMMLTVFPTISPMAASTVRAEEPAEFHPAASSSPAGGPALRKGLPAWRERVQIGGTFELDFAWRSRADAADRSRGSESELLIRKVELGFGVEVTDWLKGGLVLAAENLGTENETDITVDEATVTFRKKDLPLSLVAGKRTQPFGRFENHLVADPMTKDAYETKRPGVTVEFGGPAGLGLSATAYGGEEMMDHLFESDLFDVGTIARRDDPASDDVSSFLLSASIRPRGGTIAFVGSFLSEPGKGNRNDTVAVGAHFQTDALEGFRIDGEYVKALDREKYGGFDRKFREGVVSLTAAYTFATRRREVVGGASLAERKSHIVWEPLEIALRYERFDDDGMAGASQTFSVRNRYGGGARYSFRNDPGGGLSAYLAGEYRRTDYRVHPGQADRRADSEEELFARLGLTF